MQLGAHPLRNGLFVAPMAGVTDRPFRALCRRFGAGLAVSEMVSARPELRGTRKSRLRREHGGEAGPVSVQIAGADPQMMAEAARFNADEGAQIIDVNMGCPAKKVVKCGGSGLLRELPLLEEIFRSVRAAVKIPLTIKLRAGWDENSIVAKEVVRMAEDIGVEAAAIHPRTRLQGYSGKADWNIIAEVKQSVKIPIIGNGDVQCPEDAARMVKETGCDAVMIGRAAATNPWIFAQMKEFRETGKYSVPTEADRHALLSGYYRQILNSNAPDSMGKMKQFACWFTHGVENGGELRRIVHLARTPGEVVENVERFFERKAAGLGSPAHERDRRESCTEVGT